MCSIWIVGFLLPAIENNIKKEDFLRIVSRGSPQSFEFCSVQQASVAPILIRLGSPHVVNQKLKLKSMAKTKDIVTDIRFTSSFIKFKLNGSLY